MFLRRIVLILALVLVLAAPSAHAFFDPPWITPAAPRAGEVVSVNIRMGICDAIVFRPGYPQITRAGSAIHIVEYGNRVSSDLCIYPTLTTTESLGDFLPGNYVLTVDFVYDDYPLGFTTITLGVIPFIVTGATVAAQIPTSTTLGRSVLLILISGSALWALRMRRRSER
jgi:hypothetical protein